MAELKRVLIMAGGTGGHVFPGLAIADLLSKKQIEVHWLGTQKGLEAQLVPQASIPLHFITVSGIRGKGWRSYLLAPGQLLRALFQAMHCIRQLKPDVIIGMGGFVSGPGGLAAFLLRKKLVIHEQNAKPGLTNQWLAKIAAAKVLEAFPNTFQKRAKVTTVGNPIRNKIGLLPKKHIESQHLLVMGGSLGAMAINHLLPKALQKMPAAIRPKVLHQTGEKHFADTCKRYQEAGVTADIVPFIAEIDKAYAWADMVLCRAGALTISEICAAGLGAILVPYPYAVDDHQTANANFMANRQAALLIQQAALTEDVLAELLTQFYSSREKRSKMAEAAYQLRQVDAAQKIVTICQEMCL